MPQHFPSAAETGIILMLWDPERLETEAVLFLKIIQSITGGSLFITIGI
jgi:hypothetical protein